jgi:hypothetical protein
MTDPAQRPDSDSADPAPSLSMRLLAVVMAAATPRSGTAKQGRVRMLVAFVLGLIAGGAVWALVHAIG